MLANRGDARRQCFVFHARMNVRYHDGMERICGLCLKLTAFFSLSLASAVCLALTDLLPFVPQGFAKGTVSLLAVIAINGMVPAFGVTANKLAHHRELKLNWTHLLAQAEETGVDLASLERQFPDLHDLELPHIEENPLHHKLTIQPANFNSSR